MARRKRVQVGWYCNHEDEKLLPPYAGSHMSTHGKWKRSKWVESVAEPNTTKALTFLDYRDSKKPPNCPLAVPIYIYVTPGEKED
jgi:hypothetical protein